MLKFVNSPNSLTKSCTFPGKKRQEHDEYRHSTDYFSFFFFFHSHQPDDFSLLCRLVILTNNKTIHRQRKERKERDFFPGDDSARCMMLQDCMNFSEFCVPFCVARRGLFPRSSMNSSFTEACRPTANARSSVDNQGPSFFWPKFFLFVLLSM